MKDFRGIGCVLLAVFSCYLLQVTVEGANLVINPAGETQNQPAGKSFALTCQGEAENLDLFSQMKWRGPKGELQEGTSGPVEVSSMGNTLILMFKSPSTDDTGMYNCTAVYDNIDRLSTAVNMIFYQDITWEDCPKQQALVINRDGKINCRVSANPAATITWSRHGQPLGGQYTTKTDGVQVRGVSEGDKGDYMVRAMVPQTGRFQNRVIKVDVHVPPAIIELDDSDEAIEGTEKMLQCKASGFPRPLYSWLDRNQRNLSFVDGYTVDADTGTLVIHSVKQDDVGIYTCRATNPAGQDERRLDFTVIVKPDIREFNNLTVVENQDAKFECHAYGDPPPEVSIRKDGREPFVASDDGIELTRKNEKGKSVLTLTINTVSRSDDGLYFCMAENRGASVTKVGHLTVEFSPVMSSSVKTLVKTWNGEPMNLTCIAESIPNATISWSYMGQDITNNNQYTVYKSPAYSNLLVRPPMDFNRGGSGGPSVYGTYKCNAQNPHGSQHINIELREAFKPGVLHNTEIEKETATTLTFRFHGPSDDGGLSIRSYLVKYYEENMPIDENGEIEEWSEGMPYVLGQLKPRRAYIFRFASKNDAGISEWSDQKRIVMPPESAPEAPKFIIVGSNISTYPDRYHLRWTIPLDNGRKIEFFEVRYYQVRQEGSNYKSIGDAAVRKVTDWENAPSYEMRNLRPGTSYKVEVRAFNNIGYSQDATMVFQTASGSELDTTSDGYHAGSSGSLSYGAIAAIIIVLVLVILLVVDVTCFVRNQWGLLYTLRDRVCARPINDKAKEAAAEEGKVGKDSLNEKSRTEVDNPAFDKEMELKKLSQEDNDEEKVTECTPMMETSGIEKVPLKSSQEDNEGEMANEHMPMMDTLGAKDTKPNDSAMDNKSPKGSKSSIAKDV